MRLVELIDPGEHVVILGQGGCGKTTLARALVQAWPQAAVVFDVTGKWRAGYLVRDNLALLGQLLEQWDGVTPLRITYHATSPADVQPVADLVKACEDCLLVIEETSSVLNPQLTLKPADPVGVCIRRGREDHVTIVVIAHRPADVHRIFTAQAVTLVSYRIEEPDDVRWVAKRVAAGRQIFAERLPLLQKYHALASFREYGLAEIPPDHHVKMIDNRKEA